MKPLVIPYATREGQTRHIAEYIEARIRDRGHSARLCDVREIREPFDLDPYEGAILAASVHTGTHEPEMIAFVKRHRSRLDELQTAFLSVSLTEASAEDTTLREGDRTKAAAEAQTVINRFLGETGWQPKRVEAVAGALLYSKYNFIVRFVMKRIARKASRPTDTSHDYEFTNWKAIDALVDEVLREHVAPATQVFPSPA